MELSGAQGSMINLPHKKISRHITAPQHNKLFEGEGKKAIRASR